MTYTSLHLIECSMKVFKKQISANSSVFISRKSRVSFKITVYDSNYSISWNKIKTQKNN